MILGISELIKLVSREESCRESVRTGAKDLPRARVLICGWARFMNCAAMVFSGSKTAKPRISNRARNIAKTAGQVLFSNPGNII